MRSPGENTFVSPWQEKKKTLKTHDRWMFDSSIHSLSPPTFACCQNTSRMSVSGNDEQSVPELNLVKR